MSPSPEDDLLVHAQIGDLPITRAGERNDRDLLPIAAQIETECAGALDFIFLPGDKADDGRVVQCRLNRTALKMLSPPVHVITGDHDMAQGSLADFYAGLRAARLPRSVTVGGTRCLFLDSGGPGAGSPDFRFDEAQLAWLGAELVAADEAGQRKALVVHTDPADLKGAGQTAALNPLIAGHGMALVVMGHTHHDEFATDGHPIFAATRSTGQIEEVARCECRIDGEARSPMARPSGERRVRAPRRVPEGVSRFRVTVRAVDALGRPARDSVEVAAGASSVVAGRRDGVDADAIGAWPARGILGTRLGPDRNGAVSS